MSKDIELSFLNVNKTYQKNELDPVIVESAEVVNNELIVTNSDASVVNQGRFKGAIGNETESVYISNDSVIQENTLLPSNTYSDIKYKIDYNLEYVGTGLLNSASGLSVSQTTIEYIKKKVDDPERLTFNDITYRYVVPKDVTWVGPVNGVTTVTTSDGIIITSPSIWNSVYSLTRIINRTVLSTSDGHLWGSSASLTDTNFIIELPNIEKIDGVFFKNLRADYSVDQFEVLQSSDGINFTSVAISDNLSSNRLADYYLIFNTRIKCKYIKFQALSRIRVGAVGRFDLLVNESQEPEIAGLFDYKAFEVDNRFFTLTETETELQITKKSNAEIISQFPAIQGGMLKWDSYCRFEERSTATTGSTASIGYNTRALNTPVINNLQLSAPLPVITLPAGIYYINAEAAAHRVAYSILSITDLLGNILINGNIQNSINTSNNAFVHCTINDVLILSEETNIQLRQYSGATTNTSTGVGYTIDSTNTSNLFSFLELWKVKDIVELSDVSAQDTYWDDVVLLLNGNNTWSDTSKYKLPIQNINNMQIVPTSIGYGFASLDSTARQLSTSSNSVYSLGTEDFTIEFKFNCSDTSGTRILFNYDNWNGIGSTNAFCVYVNSSGFNVQTTSGTLNYTQQISLNSDYDVAFCRTAGLLSVYLNGFKVSEVSQSLNFTSSRFWIGRALNVLNTSNFSIISNLRVTKGVSRYIGNSYTPTISAFTKDSIDNLTELNNTLTGQSIIAYRVVGDEPTLLTGTDIDVPFMYTLDTYGAIEVNLDATIVKFRIISPLVFDSNTTYNGYTISGLSTFNDVTIISSSGPITIEYGTDWIHFNCIGSMSNTFFVNVAITY